MNPIFAGLPTTIFEAMSALARQHGAVNLGQGFPDDPGPADVRAVAARAVVEGNNQYPPMMGLPSLRQAAADHYRRWQGLELDPSEVMVTSGATEACWRCSSRATRWCSSPRSTTPTCPSCGGPAGCRWWCAWGRPTGALTRRRSGRPSRRARGS